MNSENIFLEEGVIEIVDNLIDIEYVDIEEVNDVIEDQEDNIPSIPINIIMSTEDIDPIDISDLEDFNNIKSKILKSQYVSIYKRDNKFHLVTDTNLYYRVDIDTIPSHEIAKILVFRKPKKILFNIDEYKELILEHSIGFWDLKLIMKLLWGIEVNSAKELLQLVNISLKSRKNIYGFCSNFINLAKEINIYVEKNNLNKILMIELDIMKEAKLCEKRGIPIDSIRYEEYNEKLSNQFSILQENMINLYGESMNFSKINTIFDYLYKHNKILSLSSSILEDENKQLYTDLNTYNKYQDTLNHVILNDRFIAQYNTYDDYEVKIDIIPENYYLDIENQILIEGIYYDLYYKVLCELTRDKSLIQLVSINDFIENLNVKILGKGKLGIYSEILLRAFANGLFKPTEIQIFSQYAYKTSITEADIDYIVNLFKEKASNLFNFILNFDGKDVIYERYNKKIFNPSANLEGYIKQIMNLIFKTAVMLVKSSIDEYNTKYRYDDETNISIIAFYQNRIILSATERSYSVAIDILNRYMASAYKKFIKNAKFYNNTRTITKKD
ncbi:hypothetical protein NE686_17125 [Tissierella carlieri]|uniref:Uncharacterized protein n=1 Tax=Tissierella carlieri TaxID=689904 RepID=A0ABT1SFY6_9FIRM|nr:hypothetical protein [Tissierella carlieri]MCQ4924827.1 hypothetical protein [Tissierella carlieri]